MLTLVFGPFLIAFLLSLFSIPVIIKVADQKQLMDEPDGFRKIHKQRTPTLGGIAIFAGTLFSYSFFTDFLGLLGIHFLVPSLLLLFFAGIKDDILLLSPAKKLLVQMVCAAIIVYLGNLYLTDLWGMFGIKQIPPFVGGGISFFLIVSLINAFNLIDGINGLAGTLGTIAALFFGGWFYLVGIPNYSILCFSLAGALIGFLYFNFNNARIFMGDTGSMIVGFIASVVAIKFVEANRVPGFETSAYYIKTAPAVALAPLLIPLFDMARVFSLRILNGRNPFLADKGHIHHILLDKGYSHRKITVIISSISLALIFSSLKLSTFRSLEITIISLILLLIFILVVRSTAVRR